MHRINFGVLKKTVAGAVTSAAHGARELAFDAKEALERALVAKCLRPYVVKEQIGTSGPKGLWKIYAADYRNPGGHYPSVSVWILEKKQLQDGNKSRSRLWDPFLDQQRAGAALLLRLKHPGILKLIEPLEETRTQFVMVTEPVFCSLSDWMTYFSSATGVSETIRDVSFSELEIKHGLLQLASAIGFLHNDASLTHCLINPESVLICSDGHWALANLGMGTQTDFTGSKTITSFDYSYSSPALEEIVSKPCLEYIAPELATGRGDDMSVNVTPAADVFSFGLLIHSCLTRVALLCGVEHDIGKYRSKISTLAHMDLSTLPTSLQPFMRIMLSEDPQKRSSVAAVSTCAYFQDDVLLRALQFLDGMVGKDPMQRASFLKDLEKFWPEFDVRIIRYKVLPQLMQELQNPALQPLAIPFVFKAAGNQQKEEFRIHTLPKLKAVLTAVKGDALLTVFSNCDSLTKVMTNSMIAEVLLPVFIRAFDQQHPKIQEEALRKIQSILDCMDYQQLKSQVLPRIHMMSMKTGSAKVRVNSLVLMGNLTPRLDKEEAQKMISTCQKIVEVDKSPGTLMSVLGLGDAISKFWGEEMTAQFVLPFLSPLLVSTTLSNQQFSTYLTVVRDMISRIEEKVGKQIRASEPIPTETTTKSGYNETSSWDTGRPKDLMNGGLSDLVDWTTDFSKQKEQTSITTTPSAVAASTGSNQQRSFINSQPTIRAASTGSIKQQISSTSTPIAVNFSMGTNQQQAPPAFAWSNINDDVFNFSATNGAKTNALPLDAQFFTSGPPMSQLPRQKPSIPAQTTSMLNPMDFGLGTVGAQPQSSPNQTSGAVQSDLLAGLSIAATHAVTTLSSTTAVAQDPFLSLAASPSSVNKSTDPFADLL